MELKQNAKKIELITGPMMGKQTTHEQDYSSVQEAAKDLVALCNQAAAAGWKTFKQLHPSNSIGEEYYLPKEELYNRINHQLNPQTDDNKTIRESEQRKD